MVQGSPTDDGAWRWVVVFGAFISHFITCGFEKGYSIIYVEIIRVYGSSAAMAATLGGFASAVRLLLAPLSVSLSDIYSEQKVVMAGGILAFLGLLISALSDHFAFVFIGYGVIFGKVDKQLNYFRFRINSHFHTLTNHMYILLSRTSCYRS